MIDYSAFLASIENTELSPWLDTLPRQIQHGLSPSRYGDLAAWTASLARLPDLTPSVCELDKHVRVGDSSDLEPPQYQELNQALIELRPWRKGPYDVFGIHIDTEWRSDWKWDRLVPHISPLKDRRVLDVGCGNGYHCWRMRGAGAHSVIGIDPSPRFVVQFYMLKKYLAATTHQPVDVLPVGIEDMPANLRAFDSTFSMGVLYHRRSPIDHLTQLRDTLRPGGELILETLIIEGKDGEALVPPDRYAKMRNVWFIPSAPTLIAWLKKCGFDNVRCVDINRTSTQEQRATQWMTTQSLKDFLDPGDAGLTVEGHPSPLRGIFVATRN